MDRLISVVIPTFNRKALTDQAVDSVVSVFPELVEIIVVDDCGSFPYLYGSAINSSGIDVHVTRLPENGGAGMARKAGAERAKGKYIAFLDSDDHYDKGWIDYAISELQAANKHNRRLLISGVSMGERPIGALVRKVLASMPGSMQLAMSRVVAMIFNPFYTPSIVVRKDLCGFKDGLRYSEDYYTAITLLFQADMLLLPSACACHLGRQPNSAGGLSGATREMYLGEMEVRLAVFTLPFVPFRYKLLLPVGMLYQLARPVLKRIKSRRLCAR